MLNMMMSLYFYQVSYSQSLKNKAEIYNLTVPSLEHSIKCFSVFLGSNMPFLKIINFKKVEYTTNSNILIPTALFQGFQIDVNIISV